MFLLTSLSFASKTVIFSAKAVKGKLIEIAKDNKEESCFYCSYVKKRKPEISLKCYEDETLFKIVIKLVELVLIILVVGLISLLLDL